MPDLFLTKAVNNNITAYFDKRNGFMEIYDHSDNTYIRRSQSATNKESFMRSFPISLSISIVSGCKARDACYLDCYCNKKEYNPLKNMSFESFKKIIDEGSREGLLMITLTGSGDPNDHPNFHDFVRYAKKHNLYITCVTTGFTMNENDIEFFKENIDKVEFNLLYGYENSLRTLKSLINSNINVSLNFTVSSLTIDTVIDFLRSGLLEFDEFGKTICFKGNNAIGKLDSVMLHSYKQKGLGILRECLNKDNKEEIKTLISVLNKKKNFSTILLEPCFKKLFASISKKTIYIPDCECGRYVAHITENMIMTPCEFIDTKKYGESLHNKTIEDAFNGEKFVSFREDYKKCLHCHSMKER